MTRGGTVPRVERAGPHSLSQRAITTTFCVGSNTCAVRGSRRTRVWPRRTTSSRPSATRMAAGRWRTCIPTSWTPSQERPRAGRAGGTRCAPYECWTGIQHETNADAAGRRLATSRTGPFSNTTAPGVAGGASALPRRGGRLPRNRGRAGCDVRPLYELHRHGPALVHRPLPGP